MWTKLRKMPPCFGYSFLQQMYETYTVKFWCIHHPFLQVMWVATSNTKHKVPIANSKPFNSISVMFIYYFDTFSHLVLIDWVTCGLHMGWLGGWDLRNGSILCLNLIVNLIPRCWFKGTLLDIGQWNIPRGMSFFTWNVE